MILLALAPSSTPTKRAAWVAPLIGTSPCGVSAVEVCDPSRGLRLVGRPEEGASQRDVVLDAALEDVVVEVVVAAMQRSAAVSEFGAVADEDEAARNLSGEDA